ncbi:MAG: hypothetical protein MJZ03_06670 [archaeon]|nr:hypothetical protein [archaeon]
MFCVKCGKDDVKTINGLCFKCFLNDREIINMPHHIDLMKCANCEEYLINNKWVKKTKNLAIEEIALETVETISHGEIVSAETHVEKQEDKTFVVHVQANVNVSGTIVTGKDNTIVRLKNTVCKRCSRQLGNYYEAIMQIRIDENNIDNGLLEEVVKKIKASVEKQAKINRLLFISNIRMVSGGADIFLSSISLGKSLTRNLSDIYGAEIKESASLVGVVDSQETYRVTFLLRFPAHRVGDIIQFKDKFCKLIAINKNGGKIINLHNFIETSIKKLELFNAKIVVKAKDIKQAMVVSSSLGELQVVHPITYVTKDIRVPQDIKVNDTVSVVDIESELLYVP